MSVALLFEYESALTRPAVDIRLSRSAINDILDYVCATADRQQIHYLWRPTLSDPGDDLVLEVAAQGACDRIVTFNLRDFTGIDRFGLRAETPASFLSSIERSSS